MNDQFPYSILKFLRPGLIFTLLAISITMARADGTKPPATGELFSGEGDASLATIMRDAGVTTSIAELNGAKMIKVDFTRVDGYPGIDFPTPAGGWDLRGFTGAQVQLNNPGSDPVTVNLKIANAGDWTIKPWSADVITLAPGETKTLKVKFGEAFRQPGFKLDPAHVTGIRIYVQGLKNPASVLVGKPAAINDGGASSVPQ